MAKSIMYRLAATASVLVVVWLAFVAAGGGSGGMLSWMSELDDPMERGMAYIAIAFHAIWSVRYSDAPKVVSRLIRIDGPSKPNSQYRDWQRNRAKRRKPTARPTSPPPPEDSTSEDASHSDRAAKPNPTSPAKGDASPTSRPESESAS
jgi:hypothetical protein